MGAVFDLSDQGWLRTSAMSRFALFAAWPTAKTLPGSTYLCNSLRRGVCNVRRPVQFHQNDVTEAVQTDLDMKTSTRDRCILIIYLYQFDGHNYKDGL